MKKLIIFGLSLFACAFVFTSCGEGEEEEPAGKVELTGISLDKTTLTLSKDDAPVTLKVTFEPSGATGTVSWTSSNPVVASVDGGTVYPLSAGVTTITALCGDFTATCEVSVVGADVYSSFTSMQGDDYYIIVMGGQAQAYLNSQGKKVTYIGTTSGSYSDCERPLEIWIVEGAATTTPTFVGGSASGQNIFEDGDGWISLIRTTPDPGWAGGAFTLHAYDTDGDGVADTDPTPLDLSQLMDEADDFVFHIALKSTVPNQGYHFYFRDPKQPSGVKYDLYIGQSGDPYTFPHDGGWYEIEVPMSTIANGGCAYSNSVVGQYFCFLDRTPVGQWDFDQVYFYKPKK